MSMNSIVPRRYGLVKLHKDGFPVRPVVSFVNSTTYNLAKQLNFCIKKRQA